jgi:hypothetical protein
VLPPSDRDEEDGRACEVVEEPEPDEEPEAEEEPEGEEEPEPGEKPEREEEPEPGLALVLVLEDFAVVDEVADVMLVALVVVGLDPGSGVNGSRATPSRWTVAPLVVSATGWAELVGDPLTASARVSEETLGDGAVLVREPPPPARTA